MFDNLSLPSLTAAQLETAGVSDGTVGALMRAAPGLLSLGLTETCCRDLGLDSGINIAPPLLQDGIGLCNCTLDERQLTALLRSMPNIESLSVEGYALLMLVLRVLAETEQPLPRLSKLTCFAPWWDLKRLWRDEQVHAAFSTAKDTGRYPKLQLEICER